MGLGFFVIRLVLVDKGKVFFESIALGFCWKVWGFLLGEWNPNKRTLRDPIHNFPQINPFQHRNINSVF
jgi:hypothetical protein